MDEPALNITTAPRHTRSTPPVTRHTADPSPSKPLWTHIAPGELELDAAAAAAFAAAAAA